MELLVMDNSEMLECSTPNNNESGDQMGSSSASHSYRKRGVSKCAPPLPDGRKRFIKCCPWGLPNEIDDNSRALSNDIGLQVREMLPVGYMNLKRYLPLQVVVNVLKESYDLKYVKDTWLHDKIKKSWRDKKYNLRRKYIYGKDLAEVRASPAPPFETMDDWKNFIDLSITPEFKALSL